MKYLWAEREKEKDVRVDWWLSILEHKGRAAGVKARLWSSRRRLQKWDVRE